MIDVVYVTHNRLEMTEVSFDALLKNTNWDLVRSLIVFDDQSSDGTLEFLQQQQINWKFRDETAADFVIFDGYIGGPVAAMNQYLEIAAELDGYPKRKLPSVEYFAKVDNDFVMPRGWLDTLLAVMGDAPELDILGTEPFVGLDTEPEFETGVIGGFDLSVDPSREYEYKVGYTPCRHIGGKGLLRLSAFKGREMNARGRYGFTEWQHTNEDVTKGWITPDIKSFGLDQLPFEPWVSLTQQYVERGWQREWPKYSPSSHEYWAWWLEEISNGTGR